MLMNLDYPNGTFALMNASCILHHILFCDCNCEPMFVI
uniref:Uncharacterized protein n=1 Tax=Arundo donax TaxID=35708 RepID=A0A0A9G4W6_ARUDO